MFALVRTIFAVTFCRQGPEDLPASNTLLAILTLIYAGCVFIQAALSGWTIPGVAPLIGIEVLMLFGWVWALLAFFGRRARFLQTMAAVLGIALLLTLVDIALLLLDVPRPWMDDWSLLRLLVMVLLVGRVLMLAVERGLLTGFAFTATMILSIIAVGQLFTP